MVEKVIITVWSYKFYRIDFHISSVIYKYVLFSRDGFTILIKSTKTIICNIDELVIN